ncbi:nitrate reductase cytochrome c-type subunit [Persephonella sp. KM09-Lau-8]|uniref:nitrate reductase cytochrome c-type subunit n=1 Tax=Persephonella sp. KM09-Lau-8 TaxID=1158345 RepID=UPI0004981F52|nr:nitrate reductase cytochrome c-type subunit [Persephonella sp. KM09-Lau-8]
MLRKKIGILMAIPAMGISIALVGCQTKGTTTGVSDKVISEEELSYRNIPLDVNATPPPVEFPKTPPGQSQRFERAYENAPPMIPHSVEGLLPITKNNNACLGCHDPKVAKSVGATPIPPTHFIDFFQLIKGKTVKLNRLDPARWNCSQCHAPQANAKPLVKNTFRPEYTSPEAKKKSLFHQKIMEGVY